MVIAAFQRSVNDNSQAVAQMQQTETEDIQKQNTWRKHHGIEDKQGIGPWMPAEEKLKLLHRRSGAEEEQEALLQEQRDRKKVRRWFGIW